MIFDDISSKIILSIIGIFVVLILISQVKFFIAYFKRKRVLEEQTSGELAK